MEYLRSIRDEGRVIVPHGEAPNELEGSPPRTGDARRRPNSGANVDGVILRALRRESADLEQFRRCFEKNGPTSRTLGSLEWQYFGNTTSRLLVDLATTEDESRIAAVYATLPGWMRIEGARRLVVQSLDTMTDSEFRGRGLFVTLAKRTFARASEEGAALVYGFPNGNSAHGFFQKLGWTSVAPIPFLIRPLRLPYIADRLTRGRLPKRFVPDFPLLVSRPSPAAEVLYLNESDERVTRLWHRFSRGIGIAVERDARFLQWRLFEKPGERYRTLAFRRGTEFIALCSFDVKTKHGGRIGYVMELLHDPSAEGRQAGSHLLALAIATMADEGADSALAWAFPHSLNFMTYARNAFLPLPERLRPIELHFGARAFDPAIARAVADRKSWYLSYLDSDTV